MNLLLAAVAWLSGGVSPAHAAASAWAVTDQAQVRLIAGVDTVGERQSIPAGIHFRLAPGWKIYWRSPGDAGFPPHADWSGSRNVTNASIAWPVPERFSVFDMETLGYSDEVVLPVTVTPDGPGAVELRAALTYLVCADICIPQDTTLALSLPAGPAEVSEHAHLLARYAARVPPQDGRHGLSLALVSSTPGKGGIDLTLKASAKDGFVAPDLFVEGPAGAYFSKPTVALGDGGHTARLTISGGGLDAAGFAGQPLRMTLVDGDRSLETTVTPGVTPQRGAGPPEPSQPAYELPVILLFALLGGLILNLMPCVLPVLSIKLLAVVGYGGAEARKVRIGFLAAAAGILVSFLAIAAALIAVKAAGASIGWGIQFQQPVFLVLLTLVLTLFAANLFDLFEIRLPGPLADFAVRHGQGSSLAGHFLTGMLATLLATPCTAPFLGTAVGFALSRGAAEIILVLSALGLGLALPYLAVAAFPALVSWLPRPGRWMIVLRRILALALVATVAWLLSVLHSLIGADAVTGVALLLALILAVLAARRLPASRIGRQAGLVVAGLAVAVVLVSVFHGEVAAPPPSAAAKDGWIAFDEDELQRLVARGKVVLVDVTADWCITCQVNKRLVLDDDVVEAALQDPAVVTMRADWTRPDPRIPRYLASFGRYGIPFNAVYGPGAPGGIALPELLDKESVLSAINTAGAGTIRVAR